MLEGERAFAQMQKLASLGTAQHVAMADLKRWTPEECGLQSIEWALQELKDLQGQNKRWELLREFLGVLYKNRHNMLLYSNVPDPGGQPHFFHELSKSDQEHIIKADLFRQTAEGSELSKSKLGKWNADNREF